MFATFAAVRSAPRLSTVARLADRGQTCVCFAIAPMAWGSGPARGNGTNIRPIAASGQRWFPQELRRESANRRSGPWKSGRWMVSPKRPTVALLSPTVFANMARSRGCSLRGSSSHGDLQRTQVGVVVTIGEARRLRVGTVVTFNPSPASRALYSRCPPMGAIGHVTTVSFGGGVSRTYLDGPGGGLLYVDWRGYGPCGVAAPDVVRGS